MKILGDAEQRAAYDHLLALEHQEQEQAARQARGRQGPKDRFRHDGRLPGISVVAVGGYALFVQLSANALTACNRHHGRGNAYRQLPSLLRPAEDGAAKRFQLRRRKHPGRVDITTFGDCAGQPRPRRAVRDDRSATPPKHVAEIRSLPTLIAASFLYRLGKFTPRLC